MGRRVKPTRQASLLSSALYFGFLSIFAFVGCSKYPNVKLAEYRFGGDFTLTSADGNSFSLSELRGKPVLLFFGYRHCPDVCPAALSKIGTVYKELGDKASTLKTIFITVDPERDTPALLKEYLSNFPYRPIGLTGNRKEVEAVLSKYKAFSVRREGDSKAGYSVDHSTKIYLIDDEGRLRYLFSNVDPVEKMAYVVELQLDEIRKKQR